MEPNATITTIEPQKNGYVKVRFICTCCRRPFTAAISMAEKLLTIREAAERSAVSEDLIRKAIDYGELSYISLGFGAKHRGSIRIRESALHAED
jgi:excisionase family DNA binding protein